MKKSGLFIFKGRINKYSLYFILLLLFQTNLFAGVQTNHIVISEICPNYGGGVDDEFIELYNPTSSDIDLAAGNYRIERAADSGDPTYWFTFGVDWGSFNTTIIPAHGFYLIVNSNASTNLTNMADALISDSKMIVSTDDVIYLGTGPISGPTDPDIVDFVGYNGTTDYEGSAPAPAVPGTGGSIERKAWAGATSNSMANGADTNHGNAFDSDDNGNDFVQRTTADPQNTTSSTEAPYFPDFEVLDFALNGNVPEYVSSENEQNVNVMAFNLTCNSNGRTLTFIKVSNSGTMSYPDDYISVKLWHDNDLSTNYSAGDTLAGELYYDSINNIWTNSITSLSNLDGPDGRNFVLTIDISSSPNKSKSFQAIIRVGWIKISSGVSNLITVQNGTSVFTPLSLKVVVNEIAWAGTEASSSDEWLELYNNTGVTQDLTGWKIVAGDGEPDIVLNGTIPPYGFYLAEKGDDTTVSNIAADCNDFSWGYGWNNDGEKIILKDNTGAIIDLIDCSSGWFAGEASPGYKSMERITPSYPGTNGNWATWNGSRQNGLDAAGNNINGTARTTNSVFVPPPDIITFYIYNVPSTNVFRGVTDITIYAFKAEDTYVHNYKINQFINTSTITNGEATNISIYKDSNGNRKYDTGEPFIEKLSWNSDGYWEGTNGYNLQSGTNYVITMSLSTNVVFGHSFKAQIQLATCSGGETASASTNAYEQTIISRPPTSGNFSVSPTVVSNQYKEKFTIYAYITNKGDGIGDVVVVFSNYESEYTNYILTNAGGNLYKLDNALIPGNVMPTNYTLILKTYDSQNYDYLSNTTAITVEGNWPPEVESLTVSPSDVYAVGLFDVKFTLIVHDKDGTNKYAILNLTNIGGNATNYMTNVANYTQWEFTYTVPDGLTAGIRTIYCKVIDDSGGYTFTDVSLTLKEHTAPNADAGDDKTVNGGTGVTITGSGTAYDGAVISSYIWTIASNTTGEDITLIGADSANVSFDAPNIDGKVVLSLVVKDDWNYESAPDTVTVYINRSFIKDLSKAHPDNTVITSDKNSVRIVNLSQGTTITIWTITGNKVAEIKVPSAQDYAEWQIPDYIASGVYILFLKDGAGNTKTLKIVVIR